MGRRLGSLTLHCWLPRKGGFDLTVGLNIELPKGTKPPHGKKWCDVRTGDRITVEGKEWYVGVIRLADCDPPDAIGGLVESGRHWLATGMIKPEMTANDIARPS